MRRILQTLVALAVTLALTSCGTLGGLGNGISEVLHGAGDDFDALGDVFSQ